MGWFRRGRWALPAKGFGPPSGYNCAGGGAVECRRVAANQHSKLRPSRRTSSFASTPAPRSLGISFAFIHTATTPSLVRCGGLGTRFAHMLNAFKLSRLPIVRGGGFRCCWLALDAPLDGAPKHNHAPINGSCGPISVSSASLTRSLRDGRRTTAHHDTPKADS